MTKNNNENIDKDYNLEFEESTKHRDKLKSKKQGLLARKLLGTINFAIRSYNATIGNAANLLTAKQIDIKFKELDVNQTLEEIQSGGGGSFSIGVIDSAIKGVRRIGLPALQAINFMGWGGTQVAAWLAIALAPVETAMDHLKDLMIGGALSGLAAEVGDLKDGQSKLNSKINAQGKKFTD